MGSMTSARFYVDWDDGKTGGREWFTTAEEAEASCAARLKRGEQARWDTAYSRKSRKGKEFRRLRGY